jgi:hypothetical protein
MLNLKLQKKFLFVPVLGSIYGLTKINDEFNYFMLGFKRGVLSLGTGALIIANYKIVKKFNLKIFLITIY